MRRKFWSLGRSYKRGATREFRFFSGRFFFPRSRLALNPQGDSDYEATVHLRERGGWSIRIGPGAISLLSGSSPPDGLSRVDNIGHDAINFTSLVRWIQKAARLHFIELFQLAARRIGWWRFSPTARGELDCRRRFPIVGADYGFEVCGGSKQG